MEERVRRYNLVEGVIVEAENGQYVLYSDVVSIDNITADTLLTQLRGIVEQIEGWYA